MSAGLLPALTSGGMPIEQALRAGSAHVTTGGGRRYAIAAAQVALAVTLLFTATLLARSFVKLMSVPVGFDAAHLWSGAVEFSAAVHNNDSTWNWNTRFYQPLLERL